jgi:phosphatidylserine decarboxylase
VKPRYLLLLTFLRLLPRNLVSRWAGAVAGLPLPRPCRRPFLTAFGRIFGVDFSEVREPLERFPRLQDFFVRALKEGARPIDARPAAFVAPCDGAWGASGEVTDGTLLQLKGRPYSLAELLGDGTLARGLEGATFATLYLAPHNYHRFHVPCRARLLTATYLPGSLWPVNAAGLNGIDGLFAQNERICATFEVDEPGFAGRFVLVAVGATMVGKIRVTFDDLETNLPGRRLPITRPYDVVFEKGDEWGRFEFGSTLVLIAAQGTIGLERAEPGTELRLGRSIGTLSAPRDFP